MPTSPMLWGTICAVSTGLLWCGVGAVVSRVTQRDVNFTGFMAGSYVLAAVGAWALFPRYGVLVSGQAARLGMLACVLVPGGALSAAAMVAMNQAMRLGHHGATWTVGQSALVVPFSAGVLIWHDSAAAWNICGVACVLAAIAALGLARRAQPAEGPRASAAWLPVALLVLALLGVQQTLATVPSRWAGWTDAARLRAPMIATGAMLGYVVAAAVCRRLPRLRPRAGYLVLPCIILPAYVLMFRALDLFGQCGRAGLVYPVAVGTSIVGFGAYSVVVLREPFSPARGLGMALGAVGVVLTAMR